MNGTNRVELDFWDHTVEILDRMRRENGGVLCTVIDNSGRQNIITLGWGIIGPFYHDNPIFAIAITPARYSWHFIEEIGEFVIAVPDERLRPAADLCGTKSGRDMDKFQAAGLTPVKSAQIRPPSILECPINVECRNYTKVVPPHRLLTPEHRRKPVANQHTIYFAEVVGTYRYE